MALPDVQFLVFSLFCKRVCYPFLMPFYNSFKLIVTPFCACVLSIPFLMGFLNKK